MASRSNLPSLRRPVQPITRADHNSEDHSSLDMTPRRGTELTGNAALRDSSKSVGITRQPSQIGRSRIATIKPSNVAESNVTNGTNTGHGRSSSVRTIPALKKPSTSSATSTAGTQPGPAVTPQSRVPSSMLARSKSTTTRRPLPGPTRGQSSGLLQVNESDKPADTTLKPSHSRIQSVAAVSSASNAEKSLMRSASLLQSHTRSQSSSLLTPMKPKQQVGEADGISKRTSPRITLTRPETMPKAPVLNASTSRPTFSTLQQHYSPAKSALPKPPIPSSRSRPAIEDHVPSDKTAFEVAKMQSELLYLSLLHQSSQSTHRQYQQSAHNALRKNFEELQTAEAVIEHEEREVQRRVNLEALAAWSGLSAEGNHLDLGGMADDIQRLSRCMNELLEMSHADGHYEFLTQTFSKWLSEADKIMERRRPDSHLPGRANLFVTALPADWHLSHASLSNKLRLLEREAKLLQPIVSQSRDNETPQSALAVMLSGLHSHISTMQTELALMTDTEKLVLGLEKHFVEEAIHQMQFEPLSLASAPLPAWSISH